MLTRDTTPISLFLGHPGWNLRPFPFTPTAGPGPSTRRSDGPSRSRPTSAGTAISWPAKIKDKGGIRWQFHHVIDVLPTILEAAGIPAPVQVNGVARKPIEGVSMMYTFDANAGGRDAQSASSLRCCSLNSEAGGRGDLTRPPPPFAESPSQTLHGDKRMMNREVVC